MRIRPMRREDVGPAEGVTARAYERQRTAPERRRWQQRARHFLDVDPGGCWIADDGEVVGVALAARRDLLWILSTYAVDPDRQGRGIGKALLDAVIGYGAGCLRGILTARPNHQALRRYRRAGFVLHPTMRLSGAVDHDALPVVDGVRVGTEADLELADSIDRQVRGAARRSDHQVLLNGGPLLVCDLLTGRGYAYLDGAAVAALSATNRAVAQRLLWAAFAQLPPNTDVTVRNITSEQEWAIDVGLAAGLRVDQYGYLALRHMRPPMPYVPSIHFG